MWEIISFAAGMLVLMLFFAILPHVFDLPEAVGKYFSRRSRRAGAGAAPGGPGGAGGRGPGGGLGGGGGGAGGGVVGSRRAGHGGILGGGRPGPAGPGAPDGRAVGGRPRRRRGQPAGHAARPPDGVGASLGGNQAAAAFHRHQGASRGVE